MYTLIDKILSGDAEAVAEFYTTYSPKILRFLTRGLPSTQEAQEITNDVFLEAIDSLAILHEHKNILAWLYSIARNKRADYYRKKKIKAIILSQMPFLEIVAAEINQPEFQFERKKIQYAIEQTMHSLSEQYQKILRLHYEESIPVKELAVRFDLSFKATESLLYRARQSFKQNYERTRLSS